ncbi:hypothetical protein H650_14300 [Enterobacter sp. R4-368]|nr:hypothetical protein H650_14300 [Enterobacter sp. R4-368]
MALLKHVGLLPDFPSDLIIIFIKLMNKKDPAV